jgi:(1->4)-alpha-D-glucan 1-alpha-D-glucosylmutase
VSRDRVASYRLQLHRAFGFEQATAIADYLQDLGISHLYLSPILQARPGSEHGYDVVDHARLSTDLGGEDGFDRLMRAWEPGEVIVDIVPNHMAVNHPDNSWWWDVLKNGPGSNYAEYFDIDWDPSEERLKRSILIPILGDHYGRVLEAGDIKLAVVGDDPVVRYHEHTFPLAPSSRPHDIDAINADTDLLHEILEAQHYRLAYWKVAGQDLNYRRFFAINDLAALRIDREEVFEATHGLLASLVADGHIDGLRVDHIDGLRYPKAYLELLRTKTGAGYVVVEKILEGGEELRADWPVAGTTGYDFLARVSALFVDPDAEKPLTDLYERFTGNPSDPVAAAIEAKLAIIDTELATDVERLTDIFVAVCEDQRGYRDFTRPELRTALREVLASFEVYRTYADARTGAVDQVDASWVTRACDDARERRTDLDPELFELLADVLLLRIEGEEEAALAMRFQQASGPVMAKGIEDTLFYRSNRFVALNEVGGNPSVFGASVEEFHAANLAAQRLWPESMLATSTHDTKRSEDVRARLALLSEIPDEWAAAATRWSEINERHRQGDWPDRSIEYLLYQTLVGSWPLSIERAGAYMEKAAKEAKVHTSWISPGEHHDSALRAFVRGAMTDPRFMSEVERFTAPLITPGYINSLAQTLLKMTAPGVPDFYQGTEVWDFSLVDPDNRRPIDYDARRSLLTEVKGATASDVWNKASTGAPKLFLMHRALGVRARHPRAFGPEGSYKPLEVRGAHADNVVAFDRGDEVVVVAPRCTLSLGGDWSDTAVELPEGAWTSTLTHGEVDGMATMDELFRDFPVALLVRRSDR